MTNRPAASSTAPRKPRASAGMPATRSMAAWILARSRRPSGVTMMRAGTSGIATPPPPYPACEKSMMRVPSRSLA